MVEINNLTNFVVDIKFFLGVAKMILKGENRGMENLSIAFVNPKDIRKINKEYRKKDKLTDVLSFEKSLNFKGDFSEIIICPSIVKKQALKYKITFREELIKILIHGVLHVLGYEHEISKVQERRMNKRQEYYLSKIK